MRFVKILGYSLLGLGLLLALAVVAIVILVDPNDFKEEIAQVVKNNTGRELRLEGDLGLSFFPWLALEVRQAQLGNAAGFGDEPFAAIEEAAVGVRLWPLLNKELQIGRVRLEGMRLNLQVDGQGRSNWADLGSREPAADAAAGSQAASGNPRASIAGLTVKDAALNYRDAQSGSDLRITGLNLQTGRLAAGEPMDVQLDLKYSGGAEGPQLPVSLELKALTLDLDKQTLHSPQFLLSVSPAKIRGQLQGEHILDSPAFTAQITLEEVSLRELLQTLDIEPPQTRDDDVLDSLALEAQLAASSESLALSELKLKLDDTQMSGSLGIADFASTALRFELLVDSIDLDRYLPPAPAEGQESAAAGEPIELPMQALKELNARGTLDIGALTLASMKMTDVKVKIDAQDGVVRIDPSQAQLYSGTHRGKVTIDARADTASLALEEQLSGIDFAPIMQELFDSARLSGKGTTSMTLSAQGNDSQAWLRTLDGGMDFSVADGAVEGMDLWHEIRRAQALLKRQPAPGAGAGRTAFNTLQASATVTDGKVDNRDLVADMDYMQVTGQGTLDLASQKVDYRLKTSVSQVPAEGEGAELAELKSVEIPVRISGTLDDLKVRPDLEARVKAEVDEKVEEKKEELKEKLQDQLGKWLKKK